MKCSIMNPATGANELISFLQFVDGPVTGNGCLELHGFEVKL